MDEYQGKGDKEEVYLKSLLQKITFTWKACALLSSLNYGGVEKRAQYVCEVYNPKSTVLGAHVALQ